MTNKIEQLAGRSVVTTLWAATGTADAGSFASYVEAALGTFASDFYVNDLAEGYRAAINAEIEDGLYLAANGEVYGPQGYEWAAADELGSVIDRIGFWVLAQQYEREQDDA